MHPLTELEDLARMTLAPDAFAYITGGAGDGACVLRNRESWRAQRLLPETGRPLPDLRIATSLFGQRLEFPALMAPMAYQMLADPQGEAAAALATKAQGAGFVLSCQSSKPAGEVAQTGAPFWFQLYMQPDPAATFALMDQALEAGARALVVTMDAPLNGIRNREIAARFTLPPEIRPVMLEALGIAPPAGTIAQIRAAAQGWDMLATLCAKSPVPVLAKGVMGARAAHQAMEAGCAGVIVSNHGGRVLEALPATAEVLPEIRRALPEAVILVDGGIRTGEDLFCARALGADAALIGRPLFYALALEGAQGVAKALRRLKDEFAVTMGLMGCESPEEIGQHHLWTPR